MGRTSANNRTVNDFSVASGACQTPFQRTFSIQIDQSEKNHRQRIRAKSAIGPGLLREATDREKIDSRSVCLGQQSGRREHVFHFFREASRLKGLCDVAVSPIEPCLIIFAM